MVRSAFVGSAAAVGGLEYVLTPGTAYAQICTCANQSCGCDQTCCVGYTEFCCVLDGGYNSCPENTVMGGWWKAEGSEFCSGPRYYMDCNAICKCTDGCGGGYQFCDTGCDGLDCSCADGNCNNFLTGCFQFRYGQCNQDVTCLGRIHCRVVTCVPPWEVDPTCTRTNAEDDGTANQNAACLTPGPTYPKPPKPVCKSAKTKCEVVGIAATSNGKGYAIAARWGKVFTFGDQKYHGEALKYTVAAVTEAPNGGYWLVTKAGRVAAYQAHNYGEPHHLTSPVTAMARTPSGKGYWVLTAEGKVYSFGDAKQHGGPVPGQYKKPWVGIASTATGNGYWVVNANGRVGWFGDAANHGEVATADLKEPVVGIVATPRGKGYWIVAGNGSVFNRGNAGHYGDASHRDLSFPVVGMSRLPGGNGYWLVTADGLVFNFGAAKSYGEAH